MKRIVYKNDGHGVLVSCNSFPHPNNGGLFVVELRPSDKTFRIIDKRADDSVVAEGCGVNMHKVKINAKKKMEELGITFDTEVRGKQTCSNTCDNGMRLDGN